MSRIAGTYIDKLENKFVVVGEFGGMSIVREFTTYVEAVKEMAKMAQREEIRYESGLSNGFNR